MQFITSITSSWSDICDNIYNNYHNPNKTYYKFFLIIQMTSRFDFDEALKDFENSDLDFSILKYTPDGLALIISFYSIFKNSNEGQKILFEKVFSEENFDFSLLLKSEYGRIVFRLYVKYLSNKSPKEMYKLLRRYFIVEKYLQDKEIENLTEIPKFLHPFLKKKNYRNLEKVNGLYLIGNSDSENNSTLIDL